MKYKSVSSFAAILVAVLCAVWTTGCQSSEVFSYGEIVYKIDFSCSDESRITEEGIADALQVSDPLPPMLYEPVFFDFGYIIYPWEEYEDYVARVDRLKAEDPALEFVTERGKRAVKGFRLEREIEDEGQYLARDGFDASYSDPDSPRQMQRWHGQYRVDLSVYPDDRCMFVSYKWFEYKGLMRPGEAEIEDCNGEIVRKLEQGGFSVDRIFRLSEDKSSITTPPDGWVNYGTWTDNEVRDICISFEDDEHNVPSEMELEAMLDREFFFTTVLNTDLKRWKYRIFWMLDRFHNVLFIYHIKDKKLRVINQYKDNTENYQIVERLLKENGYTIKDVTEKTYNPNVDDLGWFPNRRGIGDPYHRYSVFAVLLRFFNDVYEVPEGVMSPTSGEIVPLNP